MSSEDRRDPAPAHLWLQPALRVPEAVEPLRDVERAGGRHPGMQRQQRCEDTGAERWGNREPDRRAEKAAQRQTLTNGIKDTLKSKNRDGEDEMMGAQCKPTTGKTPG